MSRREMGWDEPGPLCVAGEPQLGFILKAEPTGLFEA